MIKNERQLGVARKKIAELSAAQDEARGRDVETIGELIERVSKEVGEYLSIKAGLISSFQIESLDDLGDAVIMARIAKGWSQKRLAEEVGVSEQMVQRDESNSYEAAGVARVADIIDALGYEFVGQLLPKIRSSSAWHSQTHSSGEWAKTCSTVPSASSSVFEVLRTEISGDLVAGVPTRESHGHSMAVMETK